MDKYDIILCDPPWFHHGSPTKMGAAGRHYPLMHVNEIAAVPVPAMMTKRSILFLWSTCSHLHDAIDVIRLWNLRYVGLAFIWVKVAKDGHIIHGQGVRPSIVKPTTELLLAATNVRSGRPLPLLTEAMGQVVLAPRGAHSEKPAIFRTLITDLLGDRPRVELFARQQTPGWVTMGIDADGTRW